MPASAYCDQCGAQLAANARFCDTCGTAVTPLVTDSTGATTAAATPTPPPAPEPTTAPPSPPLVRASLRIGPPPWAVVLLVAGLGFYGYQKVVSGWRPNAVRGATGRLQAGSTSRPPASDPVVSAPAPDIAPTGQGVGQGAAPAPVDPSAGLARYAGDWIETNETKNRFALTVSGQQVVGTLTPDGDHVVLTGDPSVALTGDYFLQGERHPATAILLRGGSVLWIYATTGPGQAISISAKRP